MVEDKIEKQKSLIEIIGLQIEEVVGSSIDNLSKNEKERKIKSKLNTDKYKPKVNIKPDKNTTIYNPAIDGYYNYLKWDNGWYLNEEDSFQNIDILQHYPEYVPSEDAIKYLSNKDSILEIGSGNGYWSHVINENGGKCISTDPNSYSEKYIHDGSYPVTKNIKTDSSVSIWEDVSVKDHTCIPEYPDSDILLCQPEGLPWTEEILDLIEPQQKLILIACWYPGPDATPFFFKELNSNWKLIDEFHIHNWQYTNAHGYVFEK